MENEKNEFEEKYKAYLEKKKSMKEKNHQREMGRLKQVIENAEIEEEEER